MPDPFEIRRLKAVDAEDYRTIRLAALKTQPQAFGAVHADEASRPAAHSICGLISLKTNW